MYGKIENGTLIYCPSILGGTINPSAEKILSAGYLPIEHTTPPETPTGFYARSHWVQDGDKIVQKWMIDKDRSPLSSEEVYRLLAKQQVNTIAVDDDTAFRMRDFYPAFDDVVGQTVPAGFKFTHNDRLWSVVQAELTIQAHYAPGVGTESLYTEVCESHSGALEDPIPYTGNMILEIGKYYTQDNIIYLCNRDTINPVYNPLHELVGLYVEEVII